MGVSLYLVEGELRVLVTGACGMLGTHVCAQLQGQHEVLPTDVVACPRQLDITDQQAVLETVDEFKPELVIHCAAMTNVDGCTADPDAGFKANAVGAWNVACACAKVDAAMLYISTDYVFDGEKGSPYTEFDAPNPVSPYGASKLAGERAVQELLKKFYIVRTSWLYSTGGKNFALAILKASEVNNELRVVADQFGSPTYAPDLAKFVASLVGSPGYGIYHYTNSGQCSWHGFATRILQEAGRDQVKVVPIKSEEWPTPTKRPKYSVLRHYRMELLGKDTARPWEEAVAEFISAWITAKQ
jgi:dTDP-4-dehydrorhamnose reductase